tara:strand:- start:594 stop:1100 length:507 start_codon:yes stop_codon:yes gene_type:complete
MATFTAKTFLKHDDYMTPKYAWENIQQYIPKDKIIWEAFRGDGKSGDYLKELGFDVIHNDNDFYKSNEGDIIVSNPPFSKTKQIMPRLKELNKPFILIMPCSKINTLYFRDSFKNSNSDLQIIIPKKRIHFDKLIDGKTPDGWRNACNFDCFYYCYKMNLPKDLIWLD